MRPAFILLTLSALTSCQSNQVDTSDPFQTVQQLLQSEKYDEAEKYLEDKPNLKNTYWAMPTILQSKKCSVSIDSCDKNLTNLQSVLQCRQQVEKSCPDTHLSDTVVIRKTNLINKIEDLEKNIKPLAVYQKQCEAGNRWGYEVTTTPKSCMDCASSLSVNWDHVTGQFLDKSSCEEARILANENSKFILSNQCYSRYLGDDKFMSLWKTKVMHMNRPQSSDFIQDSFELYFDSQEKCEKAVTEGFNYSVLNSNAEIVLGAFGSANKNRFIKKCTKIQQPICIKSKNVIEQLPEQIL